MEFNPTQVQLKTAGELKVNESMVHKGKAVKISSLKRVKDGKHGAAKCVIKAKALVDGKSAEFQIESDKTVHSVLLKRQDYFCLGMDEEFLSLQADDGTVREDIKLGEWFKEASEELRSMLAADKAALVTVTSILGMDYVTACREDPDA